jgi:anti-sigma regulatory factor (Ser/Thr protein kinase)
LAARAWPDDELDDVVLAVSEVVSNAVEHAYAHAPSAEGPTVSVFAVERRGEGGRRLELEVRDGGSWREPPASSGFRGRGLHVARTVMHTVDILRGTGGTTVAMVSKWVPGPGPAGDRGGAAYFEQGAEGGGR